MNIVDTGGCRMEAKAILERLESDENFRIFALDMKLAGQGPNDLRIYLDEQPHGMNKEAWVSFVKGLEVPLSSHEDYKHEEKLAAKATEVHVDVHADVHA